MLIMFQGMTKTVMWVLSIAYSICTRVAEKYTLQATTVVRVGRSRWCYIMRRLCLEGLLTQPRGTAFWDFWFSHSAPEDFYVLGKCCPTFCLWKYSWRNFSYPVELPRMKTFIGQHKLLAGILFVATAEASLLQYETNTDIRQSTKYNPTHTHENTKTRSWYRRKITPALPIAGQNVPPYFAS
jgi:hypothetical protein